MDTPRGQFEPDDTLYKYWGSSVRFSALFLVYACELVCADGYERNEGEVFLGATLDVERLLQQGKVKRVPRDTLFTMHVPTHRFFRGYIAQDAYAKRYEARDLTGFKRDVSSPLTPAPERERQGLSEERSARMPISRYYVANMGSGLRYGTQEFDHGQVFPLTGARNYVTFEQTDEALIRTGCIGTVPDDVPLVRCSVCDVRFISDGHWIKHATKQRHGHEARAIPDTVDRSQQSLQPASLLQWGHGTPEPVPESEAPLTAYAEEREVVASLRKVGRHKHSEAELREFLKNIESVVRDLLSIPKSEDSDKKEYPRIKQIPDRLSPPYTGMSERHISRLLKDALALDGVPYHGVSHWMKTLEI